MLALLLPVAAAADRPFAIRYTTNDAGSITFAANTLMTCPALAPTCAAARAGHAGRVAGQQQRLRDGRRGHRRRARTFNSSSADLSLPADAVVLWAGLYWAADTAAAAGGDAAPTPAALNTVKFRVPGETAYQPVTAPAPDSPRPATAPSPT